MENNIQEIPPQTTTPPVPISETPKKIISPLVAVSILIAGMLMGFILGNSHSLQTIKNPFAKTPAAPAPTSTLMPSPIPASTENWKTYVNTQWHYSIQYPSDWIIRTMEKPIIYILPTNNTNVNDDSISIALSFNNPHPTIPDWFKKPSSLKADIYGGATWAMQNDETDEIIFWKNQTDVIAQPKYGQNVTKNLYRQILSTFRFLDPVIDEKTTVENFVKSTVFAYGKNHGLTSENQIIVKINYLQDGLASGGIGFTPDIEGSGEAWYAAKINNQWVMVEETQEPPSCKLMIQYHFPQSIAKSCIEK